LDTIRRYILVDQNLDERCRYEFATPSKCGIKYS
jgi:hypothetical protein